MGRIAPIIVVKVPFTVAMGRTEAVKALCEMETLSEGTMILFEKRIPTKAVVCRPMVKVVKVPFTVAKGRTEAVKALCEMGTLSEGKMILFEKQIPNK